MNPPDPDYYNLAAQYDSDGELIGYISREHQLLATILANVELDAELGFICGAAELAVLDGLALAMALHSPRGYGWLRLGRAVWHIVQAQREGAVTPELVEEYYEELAACTGTGLPETVPDTVEDGAPTQVWTDDDGRLWCDPDPGDEVTEGEDQPTVEGGYLWHTDGRDPEPVDAQEGG